MRNNHLETLYIFDLAYSKMAEDLEQFTKEINDVSKQEDTSELKKNLETNLKSVLEKVR